VRDPPTITGRSGKIQGASTVRTPEINEMKKRIMFIVFSNKKYENDKNIYLS
jgi:hypothetical protein